MYSFQWTIFFNCDLKTINYFDIAKPPILCVSMHMDVLDCEFFSFSQKIQSLMILTPCVALSYLLGHLMLCPKYNVIISKFKTLTKF